MGLEGAVFRRQVVRNTCGLELHNRPTICAWWEVIRLPSGPYPWRNQLYQYVTTYISTFISCLAVDTGF
jgi:hypothetical protein